MDLKEIKVGGQVAYQSKAHQGTGVVEKIKTKHPDGRPLGTGAYIRVYDKANDVRVEVRPSQVGPVKRSSKAR